MAIQPTCDKCGNELTEFGGILLSPPSEQNQVTKYHLCIDCYQQLATRINNNPVATRRNMEQEKFLFEKRRIKELFQQFPEETWQHVANFGDIDISAYGTEHYQDHVVNLENGYKRIHAKIGPAASKLFNGVRVFIAPEAPNGGQALPRQNAIILDANKMGMSVGEMEDLLAAKGEYRAGDQSRLVGREVNASELGFVHELGHILEYRAHSDMDIAFSQLDPQTSPTMYGQSSPREDYAESWLYYIYNGRLDKQRLEILKDDIAKLSST
jgi:hypothetical protein